MGIIKKEMLVNDIKKQTSRIEELAKGIAIDEANLKAAIETRDKEASSFQTQETDLVETIDIVEHAVGIIEKEMRVNPRCPVHCSLGIST